MMIMWIVQYFAEWDLKHNHNGENSEKNIVQWNAKASGFHYVNQQKYVSAPPLYLQHQGKKRRKIL